MKISALKHITFISILIAASTSLARGRCLTLPQPVSLPGSSFEANTDFFLDLKCEAKFEIRSDENDLVSYYQNGNGQLCVDIRSLVSTINKTHCNTGSDEFFNPKPGVERKSIGVTHGDKKTTHIESDKDGNLLVFSVDASGKKNPKQPYFRVNFDGSGNLVTESVKNGKTSGKVNTQTNRTGCDAPLNKYAGVRPKPTTMLDLSTGHYVTTVDGCENSLTEAHIYRGGAPATKPTGSRQ